MLDSLISILLIFSLLAAGFFLGKTLGRKIRFVLLRQLTNIVFILLLCMGIDFGQVFVDQGIGVEVVRNSLMFSSIITVVTFFLLFKWGCKKLEVGGRQAFLVPLRGCFKALLAFLIGLFIYKFTGFRLEQIGVSSSYVLYLLVCLVGMDLVGFKVNKLDVDLLRVPAVTVSATILGAVVFSKLSDFSWQEALVVSSGFGWFSLSGPMISQLVSPEMGAMAFMADFFREMFSVLFLYFVGMNQPRAAIGISGAAALDSALPFIKENCAEVYIKYAVVSGFVLTVLAPLLISFSVTLL